MEPAVLAAVTAAVLLGLAIDAHRHRRALRRLPWRIHVNGTRGKSSVVRLITAGLRAGGLRVAAKTTGSAACLILEDGREVPVTRAGRPGIIEQKRFVRWAAGQRLDAVVVECMAIRPEYQQASEEHFLQANVAVITNVRPDHLEVTGPDLDRTARAFAAVIPRRGVVVTAEDVFLPMFEEAAGRRQSRLIRATPRAAREGDPFPDNHALAEAVCRWIGVDEEIARRGMEQAIPDPGALSVFSAVVSGMPVTFVNAFAANDPASAGVILRHLRAQGMIDAGLVVVFNHRADRPVRSRLFAPFIAGLAPAAAVVIGDSPWQMARWLRREGLHAVLVAGGRTPQEITRMAAEAAGGRGTILGLGNIGGPGLQLVSAWRDGS